MPKYLDGAGLSRFWNNIKRSIGSASQEQVDAWLDNHPEATTTVQDNSITDPKLDNGGSGVITRVRMLGDAQSDFPDVFCPTFHIGNLVNGELVSGHRPTTGFIAAPLTLLSKKETTHKLKFVFYNSEKSVVSEGGWISIPYPRLIRVMVPADATYIRVMFDNSSLSNSSTSPSIDDISEVVQFQKYDISSGEIAIKNASLGYVPVLYSYGSLPWTSDAFTYGNRVVTSYMKTPVTLESIDATTTNKFYAVFYDSEFNIVSYTDWINVSSANGRTYSNTGAEYVRFAFDNQSTSNNSQSPWIEDIDNTVKFKAVEFELDNGSVNEDKLSDDVLNKLNSVGLGMPTYYTEEYTAVLHRVEALSESASARFAFMTDLHFPSLDSDYNLWLRDGIKNMVAAVSKMSRELGFSCVVAGGDYEQLPTYDAGQTKQQGIDCIADLHSWMSNIDGPKIAIAGNHEANYTGEGTSYGLTATEIRNLVSYKNVTNGIKAASDTVYYLDSSIDGIRYLFLSTTSYGALSAEGGSVQTGIAAAIANNENNYPLVVFNHFVGENQDGALYAGVKGCIDYILSLNATIIAWIGGHQHADWCYVYRDVLAISCLQSGFWTNEQSQDGTTYAHTQGTADESAFSIFTVDKAAGKIYLTRFGLGTDREFNYNTTSGEIGLAS